MRTTWMMPFLLIPAIGLTGCDALIGETDVVGWTPDRHTDIDNDSDQDTTPTVSCPDGMSEPTRQSVTVQIVVVDSNQITLGVGTAAYDNMPPVCVTPTGTRIQVLLEQGGQPYAWLRSETSAGTNEALITSTSGLSVEAFGADPAVTFGQGTWYQGTWVVAQDGLGWVHTVNGDARTTEQSLSLIAEFEVTP